MPTPITDAARAPTAARTAGGAGGDRDRTWTIAQVADESGSLTARGWVNQGLGVITPERRGTRGVYLRLDPTRLRPHPARLSRGFPLEEISDPIIHSSHHVPRGRSKLA